MDSFATVILAAGKGTRMKSRLVKVLHCIAGKPLLLYPVRVAEETGSCKTIVVAGHQKEEVEKYFDGLDVAFVCQQSPLGSGHAVMCAEGALEDFDGDVLILCGDVPLLQPETIKMFLSAHRDKKADLSVLSVVLDNPKGYGRIIRDGSGGFLRIVEHRDASLSEEKILEINTGIYCCESSYLFNALKKVGNENVQDEYYLTDIVSIAVKEKKKVQAVVTENHHDVMGINNRVDMAEAEKIMRERILSGHMKNGVTIIDPGSTYVDDGVTIGPDTVIFPGSNIRGRTSIGSGCCIDMCCMISDSIIGNDVNIKASSVIEESQVKDRASIGPFAHLRPLAHIEEDAKIGNFVEVKKSCIGKGSKVSHLTYIGDATLGRDVNIGAGTITCNYDGRNKHQTIIEDSVFVGSNTAFVAPVKIGEKALIGAGSTITANVPPRCLAVTRIKQRNYKNYFRTIEKQDKS